MFLSRKYANTRSTKALRDYFALHESQPTCATLVCHQNLMMILVKNLVTLLNCDICDLAHVVESLRAYKEGHWVWLLVENLDRSFRDYIVWCSAYH